MEPQVCVAGGGPAGLMLGLLLARQGIETVVLEKHADFLRDFRGDTVHSSTLTLLDQLGLGEQMAQLPGRDVGQLRLTTDDGSYVMADFTRLPGRHPYLKFVPQWDFLDLLADAAQRLPNFTLLRSTEVVDVLRAADGTVTGVKTRTADGVDGEVRARLTVAADGRFSAVRSQLGLTPVDYAAPMDVLWFRVPRESTDGDWIDLRAMSGGLMICIDRGEYYQCALVIAKGGFESVQAEGLDLFKARVVRLVPHFAGRMDVVASWDDVKLLTVRVNRLKRWHVPGALLIGDAAHAMSPIGGVGINLAVQDAVATARLLGPKLAAGAPLTSVDLDAVRRRRRLPTVVTQLVQRVAQRTFVTQVLGSDRPIKAPAPLRLLRLFPTLQGAPARLIGLGVRPEHLPR